jgi:hypothetical protein
MAYSDFMDVLGRLHKLTPAQRRAVAVVLAEPEEVQRPAEASEPVAKPAKRARHKAYGPDELSQLANYVKAEASYTAKEKRSIKRAFAMEFGRSAKAIDIQISNIRMAEKEAAQ